jgi:prepilin-type N-terminal cleavage/methylation domain-containing protein
MKIHQKGFTLVEIAIVLVIIGLLLGGILKGQEMIVQAKVKNSITDFSGISAAYFGYQDRYRAIPGDDAQAATRWTTPTAATAGNGDRVLTGVYNALASATAPANESAQWWDHLRRSGFVTGSGTTQPQNSFAGTIGVMQGDGTGQAGTAPGAILAFGTAPGFTNLMMCSTNLPDKVAIALDVQMDDGTPSSGSVRGITSATDPTTTNLATAASNYVETGTTIYTLCRQF